MTFAIRTADRSASLLPVIRETVARLNPNLPLVAVRTLDQQMEHHLRQERMFALFCVGFAVLAALVGHGPGDWSRRGEKFHEPSAEVLYGPRAEEYAHWGAPVAGIRLVGTMPVAIPAWCACRVDPMVALRQD